VNALVFVQTSKIDKALIIEQPRMFSILMQSIDTLEADRIFFCQIDVDTSFHTKTGEHAYVVAQ